MKKFFRQIMISGKEFLLLFLSIRRSNLVAKSVVGEK